MIKDFYLQGLGCADCAARIEGSINEMSGVSYASVNFATATLRVKIADDYAGNIRKTIEEAVRRHEPGVLVIEKADRSEKADRARNESVGTNRIKIVRLIAGAVVLATGMALERYFSASEYLAFAVFVCGYMLMGGDIILRAVRNIARAKGFDENILMASATIGAFAIGEYAEAVGVMLFYQVGDFFQELAVNKSRESIAELMDIRPDTANLMKAGRLITVSPETVCVGDVIIVKPGEKIPLDGIVIKGEAMLDTATLTGESVPRKASVSDAVLSGCVNQNGVLTIEVTRTFGESTASKIIGLVENAADRKAPTEKFITKFARYYTPAVVGLAVLIAIIPPLIFGGLWTEWFRRGLIFLVISCPCALVISIPLGFFGGICGASRKGILVKGGNYLEALNNLDLVVFDKTGTLTKGVFTVTAVQPGDGYGADELLEAVAKAEVFSNHPIALSILREYGKTVDKNGLAEYREIAGYGVSVNAGGKTIMAGNKNLMERMGIAFEESAKAGTKVYVATDRVYMGCVVISDEIKPDSRRAIAALKSKGVRKIIMLTGDNPRTAEAVATELKLDEVYGGLLPQQKVEMLETLNNRKRQNGKLAFVGDGINDAPVLAMADIGVAMGGIGSDAAIEAANVVLMTDEPSKLADAVEIARFTKRVVRQNIIFALGVKALFLIFGAIGSVGMWEAVFADVGVAILAILNATRVMKEASIKTAVSGSEYPG